jgi:hypothetical protein
LAGLYKATWRDVPLVIPFQGMTSYLFCGFLLPCINQACLPAAARKVCKVQRQHLYERRFHMPGFDGTGPMGMGSRTGGGRGFCPPGPGAAYGYGAGLYRGAGRGGIPRGGGRGYAWGGGRGRGWYGPAAPAWSPEQESAMLESQASALEQELQRLRSRIDELAGRNDK